jgi:hypothetical protein
MGFMLRCRNTRAEIAAIALSERDFSALRLADETLACTDRFGIVTCCRLLKRGGAGMAITAADICTAIIDRKPIDLSYRVFGHRATKNLYCPAIVKAFAEEQPNDEPNDKYLTLAEFEALSLAARGRQLLSDQPIDPSAPPWAQNYMKMETVSAADIVQGIKEAAQKLNGQPHDPRLGLHLLGASIDDNIDLSHLNLPFSVRLIGCAINGAVRIARTKLSTLDLSGSVVRGVFGGFISTTGSVRLRRVMSTSVVDFGGAKVADVFDASDAVVFPLDDPPPSEAFVGDRGIFNLSLSQLSNEARFMRARIYGCLTVKGAEIKRSMFLDDAILRAPLAFLERIGADVVESLGDAAADSLPLVVLTSWRAERRIANELHRGAESGIRRDFETLKSFLMAKAVGDKVAARQRLFSRLLMESPRARSTCLRGDGLSVTGSVFARGLRSSGRVRCNYVRIGGTVHFDGARMRSAHDIAQGIEEVIRILKEEDAEPAAHKSWPGYRIFADQQLEYRRKDLQNPEAPEPVDAEAVPVAAEPGRMPRRTMKRERAADENFALQMRGAEIIGNLNLRPDTRAVGKHEWDRQLGDRVTEVLGSPCRCLKYNTHTCTRTDGECECEWKETNNGSPSRPKLGKQEPFECECPALLKLWQERRERWAHIRNAYVNGQLVLDGANIHGNVDLRGILANLHNAIDLDRDAEYDKANAFLLIEQANIRGSIDLNETVGIRGVEGQHVQIGARLRFARHSVRKAKFNDQALLLGGKFQLSDARIGGDAIFLFDKNEGPSLLLSRAQIKGRLVILPAKALKNRNGGAVPLKRRKLEDALPEEIRDSIPEIDLRSVHAAEFGHMESAWPRREYLWIEGLVYEQISGHGPLAPRSNEKNGNEKDGLNSPTDPDADGATEKKPTLSDQPVWLLLAAAVFAMLIASFISYRLGWLHRLDELVGWQNALLFFLCFAFWGFAWAIAHHSEPKKADSGPRAIYWLGLQRSSRSVYQLRGLTIPLQPYVQAGKVLRSAGLILSANLLEVDRLTRRNEQLSWRNNWPAKILLRAAYWSTKYGFDPLRTIVIAIVIGSAAACIFHTADRGGYIRPVDAELLAVAQKNGPMLLEFACDAEPAGCAARPDPDYPSFSSLLFAFDVMTPGLDVGQERYWRSSPTSPISPAQPSLLFELAAPIVKIIGWLLTTAIAISLLTRVEAMIARHEE